MRKYITNLVNINQNHVDKSDYDRFYDHCKLFIQNSNIDMDEIYDSICNSLVAFSNKYLVSIAFKLLSLISSSKKVEASIVSRYLNNKETSSAVFEYLLTIKDREPFKQAIMEYLYDPEYESASFFSLVSLPEYEYDLLQFLSLEIPGCLPKQLKMMINTRKFHDISKYVIHFGHNDSYVCFLVYELFVLCFQEMGAIDSHMGNIEITICEEDVFISFKSQICVENINNFLFYFFDFMKERRLVLEKIKDNDVFGVQEILSKYLTSTRGFKISTRMKHLKEYREKDKTLLHKDSAIHCPEEGFDYLFGGVCYKSTCDCIEI